MALELIDGYAGEPHISSDDLAALNIGCFGSGDYVLSGYGDALSATMTTSNQVTVGTGVLIHDGRRAVNLSPEALTVQSGTQGQSRNDIVVARYDKASGTNIESMDLAVVKGTPVSYGTAADPSLADDEMALWRIPISGITPGTPVKLFDEIPPYKDFRDSVSPKSLWQGSWGSGSIDVPGFSKYTLFQIKMIGSLVCILAVRYSTTLRGTGGWISGENQSFYSLTAAVDGDRLTMSRCASMNHVPNGDHGATYNQTVQEIIGLI